MVNVLYATIAKATVEPVLFPHHLPLELRVHIYKQRHLGKKHQKGPGSQVSVDIDTLDFPGLNKFRMLTDAVYLDEMIKLSNGKADEACRMAGISRFGFYHIMAKHGKKVRTG